MSTLAHRLFAALFAACFLFATDATAQREVDRAEVQNPRTKPWPKEVVEAFARIPVQHRGRVKPMSTVAGFRMLNTNGKRKWDLVEGTGLPTAPEELTPTEWYLDAMLFPEQARTYEIFLVDDNAVLEELGLRFEGRKRRDRYSYDQLEPARDTMEAAAQRINSKDRNARTRVETQLLELRNNIMEFEIVQSTFSTLQASIGDEPSERLLQLFPEGANGKSFPMTFVLERWGTMVDWGQEARLADEQDAFIEEVREVESALSAAIRRAPFSLAFVPPEDGGEDQWRSAGDVANLAITQEAAAVGESELRLIHSFSRVWDGSGSVDAVAPLLLEASKVAEETAGARGQFEKIPLEISYYDGKFFLRALIFFLLGFVVTAFSWMVPSKQWPTYVTFGATTIGGLLVVTGVTIRCLLLERPPVATLYETILFITSIAVVVCLVAELLTKERVALAIATVLGAGGMFLAMNYEAVEAATAGDTMGGLVAVLNTNFWLATHVTTVTMGYSAGLLAAALAHVWLVTRLFRAVKNSGPELSRERSEWFRRFGRLIYGVLCFGLLFSVVGTILGGVWANDSWGRFWGWDPKENGALMIVLYELVILHARMGGYIRDFGVAVLSVLGGAIVAFSWWHVNQLGVGLHSYGFTSGVLESLWTYYYLVLGFIALSLVGWFLYLRPRRTLEPA
ncbi:MAG: cytochrome c biogenesis protein CcsA [Planctomycetota bacterium]